MNSLKRIFVASALSLALFSSAKAGLIGDTITSTDSVGPGFTLGPATATIGAGVEFVGMYTYLNVDFGASTLTLTTPTAVGWSGFGTYTFSDFDDIITNLTLASNVGFSGDILSGYSFTDHSITLNIGNGFSQDGASMVFNISSSPVPDGGSALALFGAALLGLGLVRRRLGC